MPRDYKPSEIEPKWQKYWDANKTFRAEDFSPKPKYYILDMFPYPSGAGLHVGHPEGYTATDILARYKRMKGFNVLHPMGWDAFGLPAEQYAVDTGTHPAITTQRNIATFKRQIQSLGFSYDWDREVNTTDPGYYRWTQWIFLQLYHRGLAYVAEVPVNWCPALGTVLSNEEVIDGRSERGGHPVVRKPMRQWMLKITQYADRLLEDLSLVDWTESIKEMQRNWIGRSIGAEVDFAVQGHSGNIRVFTTRPDTLFGATYMVLAPEHPLVDVVTTPDQKGAVQQYKEAAARKSDMDRTELAKEKTGVFTGGFATNPTTSKPIPIWVADYVLISYGTGAIMAVPAHDDRDWEFATRFGLPIVEVVVPEGSGFRVQGSVSDAEDRGTVQASGPEPRALNPEPSRRAFTGNGANVNSANDEVSINGLETPEAKAKITDWLEAKGIGKKAINYRLRDWLFSRQRYWGEPFPIVFREDGTAVPLPEEQLPILLPEVETYQPAGTGESPLATIPEWVNTTDPETGAPARRETNTMPQWAGSCWYYLRYLDPQNPDRAWDADKENYWMPVDLYVGGAEHAVLHLLYARFWHKVLFDAGLVSTPEPFMKLVNQGMILGFSYRYYTADGRPYSSKEVRIEGESAYVKESGSLANAVYVPLADVVWRDEKPTHPEHPELELEELTEKMSKSRGNVVNPDDVVKEHGADALRLYEMFLGPLEAVKPWNTKTVTGVSRFLARAFRLFFDDEGNLTVTDAPAPEGHVRLLHRTIKKVSQDTESMNFNTAIAAMMEFVNNVNKVTTRPRSILEPFVLLLAPYAPHLAEELWQALGHPETLAYAPWPAWDEALTVETVINMAVQVNGKVRAQIEVPVDASEATVLAVAKDHARVKALLEDKILVKEIVVPGRIVNLVVK